MGLTCIEDITRWWKDINFIFEWQNNILRTSAASKILFLPRENIIHIFKPPCNVLLLYRHADDGVFDDFPKISDHLPKISEDFRRFSKIVPKARRTFPNIFREFPKISEDVRRLPKTFQENPKMFRWYTNEFKYNLRDKQKQKAGIVTSLNDTTLTKVTYGKCATRVLDEVAYGIYEWLSSQWNTPVYIINNNYSMSPRWIWSDKITNERVERVGYNHLISNKGEWNNCFSKLSNRVLPPIFISTIL